MMDRVRFEEFTRDGKSFMYVDFSDLKSNESFTEVFDTVTPKIAKYPPCTLYTITNVANIRFDTETKEFVAQYMRHNKQYVKYAAIIGIDGIKKMFANAVFELSGRNNMLFAFTKEQAIELLLKKE